MIESEATQGRSTDAVSFMKCLQHYSGVLLNGVTLQSKIKVVQLYL